MYEEYLEPPIYQGSSSFLEVAGEALERVTAEGGETCVRVVCNSCLNPLDVQTVAPET